MPIFEYQCKECMTVSEFLMGVRNEESIACKNCGSLVMERILSTPFLFEQYGQSGEVSQILHCHPIVPCQAV